MSIHWPVYVLLVVMGCMGVLLSYKKRPSRRAMLVLLLYPLLYSILCLFDLYIEYNFAYVDSEILGVNDPSRIPYGPFRYALTMCWVFSTQYYGLSVLTILSAALVPVCIWRFIALARSIHSEGRFGVS